MFKMSVETYHECPQKSTLAHSNISNVSYSFSSTKSELIHAQVFLN